MNKYEKAELLIELFREDRPTLKNHDGVDTLSHLLLGEAKELVAAGLIYLSNPSEKTKDELALEIADVIIYALNLSGCIGVDAFQAVLDKLAINFARYQAKYFNNGLTYHEAINEAKIYWKKTNGIEDFKHE